MNYFLLAPKSMQNSTSDISSNRLLSLDAFRGFTVALMILVNDPGSWQHVYAPLLHAEWNGLTPTDLVFPFFLFIVGVSIVLAYHKRLKAGTPKSSLYKKIIVRSLKIFLLSIAIHVILTLDIQNIRYAGVLQRISIVFLICSFMYLHTSWKWMAKAGALILLLYWLIMMYMPLPGLGEPMLEPGKNIAAWIDSILLPGRMYRGTWDPEGIFSTFPAIVTGITGMLAGIMIISDRSVEKKIIWLFTLGFISIILGSVWNWFFPINKNIWTSSYVLYTSGAATMCLAACIFIVDVKNIRKWTRMGRVFGANAITIYVLADFLPLLTKKLQIGGYSYASIFNDGLTSLGLSPKFASLLYAISFVLICYIPAYILYKRKIFIKL